MSIEDAIRILDPETTAEEIRKIEHYGGSRGKELEIKRVNDACVLACEIMRLYLRSYKNGS